MKQLESFKIKLYLMILCSFIPREWAHAVWTPETIRQFAMQELSTASESERVFYRWGDERYELQRVESELGRGVPQFDLDSVNYGNQAGGRGLYVLDSFEEASVYVSSSYLDPGRRPALVEVVLKSGAAYIDLMNAEVIKKLKAAGLSQEDILVSDPPAMVRFMAVDIRNPGFYTKSIWVAKNPHDVVIREFNGNGYSPFDLLERGSRILDISGGQYSALEFYESSIKQNLRQGVYLYSPVTKKVNFFEAKEDFVSIAMNDREPLPGFRLDGSCGLFLPLAAHPHVISVVKSIDPEECRNVIRTRVIRSLTGDCAEVLEADPRVVIQYVDEGYCSDLFCRSRKVLDPATSVESSGYSISSQTRYLNYPVDPLLGFKSFQDCQDSIDVTEKSKTRLMCTPSQSGIYQVNSLESVAPPLPDYGTGSLRECLSWITSARTDLRLLCEKKSNSDSVYDVISYRDFLNHRQVLEQSFTSLGECQAALPLLTARVYQRNQQEDQDRVRILHDVASRHPEDLMKLLRMDYPYLKGLFQRSAQSETLETIEFFANKRLQVAQELSVLYQMDEIAASDPRLARVKSMMNTLLLLCQNGKGIGRTAYSKRLTSPMLQFYLKKWEFSEFEIKLALELFSNDLLQMLVHEEVSIEQVVASLKRKAARVGVPLQVFFKLQLIYNTAIRMSELSGPGSQDALAVFMSRHQEEISRVLSQP